MPTQKISLRSFTLSNSARSCHLMNFSCSCKIYLSRAFPFLSLLPHITQRVSVVYIIWFEKRKKTNVDMITPRCQCTIRISIAFMTSDCASVFHDGFSPPCSRISRILLRLLCMSNWLCFGRCVGVNYVSEIPVQHHQPNSAVFSSFTLKSIS